MTWSGTQFVAVGASAILTSPDGATWTWRSPADAQLHSVVWAGSQFVAVGNTAILTSQDGASWSHKVARGASSVTWAPPPAGASGGRLIAVSGGLFLASSDGITWTVQTPPKGSYWISTVQWVGNRFLALGGMGDIFTAP